MPTKLELRHALLAATLAAACGSSSPDDGGQPQDTRPAPDLNGTAKDTASGTCPSLSSLITTDGLCNAVPFPTMRVPFTTGSGPASSFTGGTLVDGLYTAIKAEGWDTSTGYGRQMGIVLGNGGTTMLWFGQTLNADGSGDVDAGTANLAWLRANLALSVSQNTMTLTQSCGAGTAQAPTRLLYTATATEPPQLLLANADAANPANAVTTYEHCGCPAAP